MSGHNTGWVSGGAGGPRVQAMKPVQPVLGQYCTGCDKMFKRADMTQLVNTTGASGLYCKNCHADAMAGEIRKRSGASTVECGKCGSRVEMHQSVRSLDALVRGGRLCRYCAGQDEIPPWCRQHDHHIVITPAQNNWDSTLWEIEPLPEWSKPALCADCGEQLIWHKGSWTEMTWPLLAMEWGRTDT